MRVSDSERQRAIDELRRHCAAGRLDVDEYAGRIEQVHAAGTLEELDRVLADLPMMRIADPVGSRANGRAQRAGAEPGADHELGAGPLSTPAPRRLAALAVVLLTVAVVVGAVLLALLASWVWVGVLLAGWIIGLAQARILRRR